MGKENRKRISAFQVFTFLVAVAAFVMSAVSLFLTYDNGRLVKNAHIVLDEVRTSLRERKSTVKPAPAETGAEESPERQKVLEKLKRTIREARSRLKGGKNYNAALKKVEELKSDLQSYQEKWGIKSHVAFDDLKREVTKSVAALKEKASNAGSRLDRLAKRLDSFLHTEKKSASEKPIPSSGK